MPIYEYACARCGKRFSLLLGITAEQPTAACPKCGATEPRRLVSKFMRARSEDERVGEMADRLNVMGEPESPSAMRQMVREMGRAIDDDVSDEMEEMYEADMESDDEETL